MHAQSSASQRTEKSFARSRGCPAYSHRERTFDSRQRSRCRDHAAQQATWRRGFRMTLDDEDIEQIARRVAELIASTHAHPAPRYVDAIDLAQMLDVDREWVYAHARRLGAIRLGGSSGRLRFDVRRVAEVLSSQDSGAKPARRAPSRRRSTRAERTEVIQYER
jgi:hypothetical protein